MDSEVSDIVWEFVDAGALNKFTCNGYIGVRDIQKAARNVYTLTEYNLRNPSLWDMTNARILVSYEEVSTAHHPNGTEIINHLRPRGNTAFVVSTGLDRSLLNIMYEAHHWATQWRIFSSVGEAQQWLELEGRGKLSLV